MKTRWLIPAGVLLFLIFLTGCSSIPDGTPPAGAVTQNPAGTEALTEREAVNRLVTEMTVLGLTGQTGAVSRIRVDGEPRALLLAAAQEISQSGSALNWKHDGAVLTLTGSRQDRRVEVRISAGTREIGRTHFFLR